MEAGKEKKMRKFFCNFLFLGLQALGLLCGVITRKEDNHKPLGSGTKWYLFPACPMAKLDKDRGVFLLWDTEAPEKIAEFPLGTPVRTIAFAIWAAKLPR